MPDSDALACAMCRRERFLTFHHLIPRTLHRNKWFKKAFTREDLVSGIDVCRDCHRAIHHFVPNEKELGRHYNTRATLLAHSEIGNFVRWVRSRDTGRVTMPPRRRIRR